MMQVSLRLRLRDVAILGDAEVSLRLGIARFFFYRECSPAADAGRYHARLRC